MFRSLKNMLTPKRDRVSPPPVVNTDSNAKHLKPADEVVSKEEAAAITLQKNIRGFIARKKYGIKQLKRNEMDSYETFVVGNDPKMPASLANYHVADEKIALVATSGMRALSIACDLGNSGHTPKIFLIDNSREVCEFWLKLRAFASDDVACGTAQKFLDKLARFLVNNEHLYRDIPDHALQHDHDNDGVKYPNQNISRFFIKMISKHGYDYVRAVLMHASVIKQSWTDTDTFVKVKNIATLHGIKKIFMYPSNIVGCLDAVGEQAAVEKTLENIKATAPVMTIHTDCVGVFAGHPKHVFLLENQEPKYVMQQVCRDRSGMGMGGGLFRMFSSGTGMPGGGIVMHDIGDLMMLLQMTRGNRQQRDDHDSPDFSRRSSGFGGW